MTPPHHHLQRLLHPSRGGTVSQGGGRTPGGWHSVGLTCASRVASRAVSSPTRLQFRHPVGRKAAGGTGPLGGGHPPLFAHANAAGLGRDPPEKAVGRREGRRGAVLGRPASRRVTKVGASAERRGGGQEGRTPPHPSASPLVGDPQGPEGWESLLSLTPKWGGGLAGSPAASAPSSLWVSLRAPNPPVAARQIPPNPPTAPSQIPLEPVRDQADPPKSHP